MYFICFWVTWSLCNRFIYKINWKREILKSTVLYSNSGPPLLGLLIYIQRILTKCHSKIIECKYLPSFLKSALHCQEEIKKIVSPYYFLLNEKVFFPSSVENLSD